MMRLIEPMVIHVRGKRVRWLCARAAFRRGGRRGADIKLAAAGTERRRGAACLLSGGGVTASLALMACCALPPLLASIGLAGAWTLEVQTFLGPHEQGLLWLSLVSLGSGAGAWSWQLRRVCTGCGPRGRVIPLLLTPLMLALGAGLTWLALHPI